MLRTNQYQDFKLTALKPSLTRRLGRALVKGARATNDRFYPTRFRKLRNGQVEVTFNLPPEILVQMRQAILKGKNIRLYVP